MLYEKTISVKSVSEKSREYIWKSKIQGGDDLNYELQGGSNNF